MIISHRKKFAFFASQKTGSKAVGLFLRLSGIFDEHDILIRQPFPATRSVSIDLPSYNLEGRTTWEVNHMTPQKAINAGYITLDQLREYNCYAFLREPRERYIASRASMMLGRSQTIALPGNRIGGGAPRKHEFFFVGDEQVVESLDFDNYEVECKRLIVELGGTKHMDVPQITRRFEPHLVKELEYRPHQHTKDIQLYKKMKNAISDQ